MSHLNSNININSFTSKTVLNSIINSKNIDFKSLKITYIKKNIEKLRKKYLNIRKKSNKWQNSNYKHFIFWEIVKKKFDINNITLIERSQIKKNGKVNIIFSNFGEALGYNPSLLSLLIFDKEIKLLLKSNNFFKDFQKVGELEQVGIIQKMRIINAIKDKKKTINLITPLCPDYEHIKIAFGLYKYTFNKLNDGLGLIGKRLIKIIDKIHEVFKKYDIKFNHYLYYGDFEAYSKNILNRLKISEDEFIKKLKMSSSKMKKTINSSTKVDLLVDSFTSKKEWLELCKKNEKKIIKKYSAEISFKRLIQEISSSRTALYASWFPDLHERNYESIVMKQGAEYTSMADFFIKNFRNPIIMGLDHPKMGKFYNINHDLPVVYGRPKYV